MSTEISVNAALLSVSPMIERECRSCSAWNVGLLPAVKEQKDLLWEWREGEGQAATFFYLGTKILTKNGEKQFNCD